MDKPTTNKAGQPKTAATRRYIDNILQGLLLMEDSVVNLVEDRLRNKGEHRGEEGNDKSQNTQQTDNK